MSKASNTGSTRDFVAVVRAGIRIHPDEPTDVMVDLERRAFDALDVIADRAYIAEVALRDITRCDYRGNEPTEQMIARLALADLELV